MSAKELSKLNRKELLEILISRTKEVEELQQTVKELNDKLSSRNIEIEKAGSIAEASLKLHKIFETAQKSADQYLENIKIMNRKQKDLCLKAEIDSQKKADYMLMTTKKKCKQLEEETFDKCKKMVEKAEKESEIAWQKFSKKMDDYIQNHNEIKAFIDENKKDDEYE